MQLDVSDIIGPFGVYHAVVLLITVLRAVPSAWTLTGIDFLTGEVDFWCAEDEVRHQPYAAPADRNATVRQCLVPSFDDDVGFPDANSSTLRPCENFTFKYESDRWSVVPEFNLVCDRRWIGSAMQSVVFGGSFVGAIFFGLISDWQGRRRGLLVSSVLFAGFATVSASVSSLSLFNALRFGQAAAVAGTQVTSAALFMELLLPRDRYLFNVGFTVGFAVSTLTIPYVSQALNSWRQFQLVTGLCALAVLPPLAVIEESPRWLVNQKRTLEAREVLTSIFSLNKRNVPNFSSNLNALIERSQSSDCDGILRLLGRSQIRLQLTLILLYWLIENGIYYADIFLSAHLLDTEKKLAFTVCAAAEIPAGLLGMVCLRQLNRRSSMAVALALGAACATVAAFLPVHRQWLLLALSALTRLLLTVATSIKWVYTLELMPTNIRSLGFAMAFAAGRVGGILAPFIRDLAGSHQAWCFAIVGCGALVASVLIFFLPETLNGRLPDSFFECYRRARHARASATGPTAGDGPTGGQATCAATQLSALR